MERSSLERTSPVIHVDFVLRSDYLNVENPAGYWFITRIISVRDATTWRKQADGRWQITASSNADYLKRVVANPVDAEWLDKELFSYMHENSMTGPRYKHWPD